MKSIVVLFTLLLFNIKVSCFTNILNQIDNENHSLDDAMNEIIMKYGSRFHRSIAIIYGTLPETIYKSVVSLKLSGVIMHNLNPIESEPLPDITENYDLCKVGLIIISANSTESLFESMEKIMLTNYWAPDAYMIIHCKENNQRELILYLLWWFKVMYCIIIDSDPDTGQVMVYDYTPFSNKIDDSNNNQFQCWSTKSPDELFEGNMYPYVNCNQSCESLVFDKRDKTMSFITCMEITSNVYTSNLTLFEDKTVNLKGYPLNMFALHLPPMVVIDLKETGVKMFKGRDGLVLNALAQKMNFTTFYEDRLLKSRGNQSFSMFVDGFMDIAYRRHDFAINTIYVLPFPYPPLEMTYPVIGSGLCFVIHKPERVPPYVNFLKMFDRNVFISLIIVFNLIVGFHWYHLKKPHNSWFNSLVLGFLHTITFFLSMPVNIDGNNVRLVLFTVFWLIFLINVMFQGFVTSFLTVPQYEEEIDTFEQLIQTNFLIEGYPSLDVRLPSTSELFIKLNKRFVPNYITWSCAKDLLRRSKKACWQDCILSQYITKTFRDQDGYLAIHLGKDRIHSHYLGYAVTRQSPYKPRMDQYVKKLLESGLMRKWNEDSLTVVNRDQVADIKVLQLSDLEGFFYLLIYGYFVSTIAFIMEIFWMLCFKLLLLLHKRKRQ